MRVGLSGRAIRLRVFCGHFLRRLKLGYQHYQLVLDCHLGLII